MGASGLFASHISEHSDLVKVALPFFQIDVIHDQTWKHKICRIKLLKQGIVQCPCLRYIIEIKATHCGVAIVFNVHHLIMECGL